VRRRVNAGVGTTEEQFLFGFLRGVAVPRYCAFRYGREAAVLGWLGGWRDESPADAAAEAAVNRRTISLWILDFLRFSGRMIREENQRQKGEALADVYCAESHGASGGSGATILDSSEFRGGTCPMCAARRA